MLGTFVRRTSNPRTYRSSQFSAGTLRINRNNSFSPCSPFNCLLDAKISCRSYHHLASFQTHARFGAAFLFGASLSIGIYLTISHERSVEPEQPVSLEEDVKQRIVTLQSYMASEIPPGRPGNLTTEQEVKLREFWAAAFKVFGVPPELDDLSISEASETGSKSYPGSNSDTRSPEKKKKKHLGVFKKTSGTSASTSDLPSKDDKDSPPNPTVVLDDKYGQSKEFLKAIADNSPDELRNAFWSMVKMDHPDGLFLRFLRARKWNVEKALVMMISTMHWRASIMHVDDDVMFKGDAGALVDLNSDDPKVKEEAEGFLDQCRLGKSFLHGPDKLGRPICLVRVRFHHAGEQSESSLERYTVYIIETARLLLAGNIDTACIVFDMTGFSMANMDYAPVKFMVKCFEANYPECLGVVLIHKAPWIFQGIWTMIKGWLDPVVASKVHFTRSVDDLKEYIEPDYIIKELDGPDSREHVYSEPVVDENKPQTDAAGKKALLEARAKTAAKYESVTQAWIKTCPGDKEANELNDKRNELAESLRTGYWEIDPYVRARTMYDRQGVIGKGGKINYFPQEKN